MTDTMSDETPRTQTSCPFCKRGPIVWIHERVSGNLWYAIPDADERRNHLLLVPRRHVAELTDLDILERTDFWDTLQELLATLAIRSYRLQVNGPGFRKVEHLHVHIWTK